MNSNFILPLALVCAAFSASAQIQKGSTLIGGQLSGSAVKTTYENSLEVRKQNSLMLNISAGYAVKQNQVWGVTGGYSRQKSKLAPGNNTSSESKTNQWNAGIFFRQYATIGKRFYFFGESGLLYSQGKSTSRNVQNTATEISSISGGNLYLTPGLAYQLFKKFHLELTLPNLVQLQYSRSKLNNTSNPSISESFAAGTSLSGSPVEMLGIGFRFVL